MITEQLVAQVVARINDKNAYRIASHLKYLGYSIDKDDMNAIRDILGETHPDLTIEAKPVQPKGRGAFSRNRTPSHKGSAL